MQVSAARVELLAVLRLSLSHEDRSEAPMHMSANVLDISGRDEEQPVSTTKDATVRAAGSDWGLTAKRTQSINEAGPAAKTHTSADTELGDPSSCRRQPEPDLQSESKTRWPPPQLRACR